MQSYSKMPHRLYYSQFTCVGCQWVQMTKLVLKLEGPLNQGTPRNQFFQEPSLLVISFQDQFSLETRSPGTSVPRNQFTLETSFFSFSNSQSLTPRTSQCSGSTFKKGAQSHVPSPMSRPKLLVISKSPTTLYTHERIPCLKEPLQTY